MPCAGGEFQPNRKAQPYFPAEISNTFSGASPGKCPLGSDVTKNYLISFNLGTLEVIDG